MPDQTRLGIIMEMDKIYTITEAKGSLSLLIKKALKGEVIAIGAAREPQVMLTVFKAGKKKMKRKLGALNGKIKLPDDLNSPDEELIKLFDGSTSKLL